MAMSDRAKKSNLCYLLLHGGTKVCRALFEKRINDLKPLEENPKTWTVEKFLQLNRTKLEFKLKREEKVKLALVFPVAPRTTDIYLWDVSLLCLILRETCGLSHELRMYLQQLRKERNKIVHHLNDADIDDSKYEKRFEKLKICIQRVLSETGDETLKTGVQDMITQLETGLIPNDELLKVEQSVRMSIEDIKQEVKHEHKETRKVIEKGDQKVTDTLDKLCRMVQEVLSNQQEIFRRLGGQAQVENHPPEITVEVRTCNCTREVERLASGGIAEIFNREIDATSKEHTCQNIDNDTELTACTEDMKELNHAVNDLCREFQERDLTITEVEVGCILLRIQCSSILSLFSLLRDYVSGSLDKSLTKLQEAARSLDGCENLRLETVIYEDEFNRVLSTIKFEQFQNESIVTEESLPEETQILDTTNDDHNLPFDEAACETSSGVVYVDAEKKEDFYLRLHHLTVKYSTEILRLRFDIAIPSAYLHRELQKSITKIIFAKKKYLISNMQYQQLYPQHGPPNSKNFDASLLYYLLRNICRLNSESKWWNVCDNSKIPDTEQSEEADIQRIRNMRYYIQRTHIASLEETEFEAYWDIMEKVLCRLAAKCSRNDTKAEIDELKSAKLDLVSEELNSLRVNSRYFFEEFQDKRQFVVTNAFEKAKTILADKNIVILVGYPGEGKTEMAARLALSLSQPRYCLRLSNPRDWRYIDLSLKLVDTIIIDDIFGAGALDQRLVSEWRMYLPEIEWAAKKKAVRVIITSRLYIFKESLGEIGSLPLFRDENETIALLSSADLTDNEKSRILKIQSNRNNKDVSEMLVRACVEASIGPTEENTGFLFGFTECASIFFRSKEIFSQGASFFKKPSMHFKSYLEDLYRKDKGNFFALVALWAKENKRLNRGEFSSGETVSEHILRIAEVFDYDVDREFLEQLQISLESHVGDYLVFDDRRQEYSFSHSIIGDMVGLVIGRKRPLESIEICPRDFLMEYISVDDASNDEFKIVVKEIHFPLLTAKFLNMLIRNNCNSTAVNPVYDDFQILRREGERSNVVKIYNTIDYGLIKHKAFSSQRFVQVFIDRILEMNCEKDVFRVPVMKMQGCFLDYGISITELEMCLMGYAWFSGSSTFAKEVISRKILEDKNADLSTSLLLATHSKQRESIEFLLSHGARVTGDVIYIAMHNKQPALLEMLLQHPGTDVNDRGNAENGNYPLIVAARKGLIESILCLLNNGADPGVKNAVNMTALHKAIIYKHKSAVTCLLEAKAPLDVKGGTFRRTPLHLAADFGDLDLAKILVRMGASLNVKDYRGHYPIHIAAIRGHVDIVRFLLTVDRAQDQWRISSYGFKSMIKGMSLFHIAVWKYKNNSDLMDALIDLGANPNVQDFFGQTPLFYAIMQKKETAVEKLLAYAKTDRRQTQKQGYTPLHAAIHKGLTKIATKLAGESDVNARDRYGRTPLHVACETSNFLMIYNLVNQHGANNRVVTKRGDTVFHILRKNRRNKKANQVECREAERFLSEHDPEFISQLPKLQNKKGITVRITPSGRRRGAASWQKLVDALSEKLEKGSISAVQGITSATGVKGNTKINDYFDEVYLYFDSFDIDHIDDYDSSDKYDAYDIL